MPTREWYQEHKDDPEYKAKRKKEAKRYWEKHKDERNAKRRKRRKEDEEYRLHQNEAVRKSQEKALSDPLKREERNRKSREWYRNSEEAQTKAREYRKQYTVPASTKAKKKAWVSNRRTDHIKKLIECLGGECLICHLRDHPVVYDFHHVDPELKAFNISKLVGTVSWDSIWKEAQKCCLLCSICHRKLHFGLAELDETISADWVNQREAKSSCCDKGLSA